jgi:hypothetical protein
MTAKKKAKVGPKLRLEPTPENLKTIEGLAGQMKPLQIANFFGLKKSGWYATLARYPEIAETIKRGRAKTVAFVSSKLMELVKKGNLKAIMFYLEKQGGGNWVKKSHLEIKEDKPPEKVELVLNTKDPVEAAKIYQKIMTGSH